MTFLLMSWKATIFCTQKHRPAAALDLLLTISGLNSGSSRYGRTAFTVASGMFSLLYSFNSCKNFSAPLLMAFCAAAHVNSFCFGTFLVLNRMMTAHMTLTTADGGLPNDRISVNSFLSRVSRASAAARTIGSAFSNSFLHWASFSVTEDAIASVFSSSTFALAFSSSTMALSFPTISSISSVSFFFSATTFCCPTSTCSNSLTCEVVDSNLSIPPCKRLICCSFSDKLALNKLLYSLMNSKKDFGVV
mmetsp:Transcript_10755/g.40252  ORF Transcript_10755/g.40252 Transcript_10755/m.40252 type:complete len:248 (+) Transcript_10755:3688-4431(+)